LISRSLEGLPERPWRLIHRNRRSLKTLERPRFPRQEGSFLRPQQEVLGGFLPEGDFTAVDPVDPWVSTGAGTTRNHGGSGNEAQLHQSMGDILGEIEGLNHSGFALSKVGKGNRRKPRTPTAPTPASAPPSSSEPASGSHQEKHLVENHFHPQTISKQPRCRSRTTGPASPTLSEHWSPMANKAESPHSPFG